MSQYLGNVSAYAYAVEKGYTGTEEEFSELMASYATVGQTAVTAATTATTKASEASQSAQTASTKASEASTSAQTASTKASEASTSAQSAASSAQTATDKATLASQKAAAASESASIADEAKTTAINNAHLSVTKADEARSSATQAANSATSAQEYDESAQASAVNAQTAQGLAEDARDLAQQYAESIDPEHIYSAFPTDTASGAVASFADGADDIPLKSLVVNIDPVQDTSSGDPSPENICPISGWTGAVISHSGVDMTNPTIYPVTFPIEAGTVYGGNLDVTNGVLTVDRAMVMLDGSNDETWQYYSMSQGNLFRNTNNGSPTINVSNVEYFLCSEYKPVARGRTNGTLSSSTASYLDFINNEFNDLSAWKAAINNRPIYVVYPIATPITYQLTPTEVKTLLGSNNIWADTGDASVVYRADTKLYIERLTEPDADMIADSNIVSGQYFLVGNSLYLATSNIESGGQVIEGTNAIRKSLATALNEINQ